MIDNELENILLFYNQISVAPNDENELKQTKGLLALLSKLITFYFDRSEKLEIRKRSNIYNEVEAAVYLRLPDPENEGRNSVRYYASTRKLASVKIGRTGLLFTRSDLDDFVKRQKVVSHRDL